MRLPTGPLSRRALVTLSTASLLAGLVTVPALAATTAGTDVLAGADALSEVSIDVNPTDPENLVIAGHEPGGFENMNTFFTTDGGDTWTEVNLGTPGMGLASNFRFHPAVIFDSAGNVYVAYGADLGATTTLVVARSTDGGATYTNFAQLANNTDVGPPGNDKLMMATGSAPGAPASRRIYIAWTQNINQGSPAVTGPAPRRRVRARTTGSSRPAPVIINDSSGAGAASIQINADPAVAPNGTVYVSWHDVPGNRVLFDRSTDGGVTWGTDISPTGTTAGFRNRFPAQPDRGIFAGPMIDVDLSSLNNGRIYLAYVDMGAGGGPAGHQHLRPDLGQRRHVLVSRVLVNDDGGTLRQFEPWLDVDPITGLVSAVWYDARNDSDNKQVEVYGATSQNGGTAWATNVKIADNPSDSSVDNASRYLGNFLEYIGLATHDCILVPVWSDLSANGGSNFDYMIDRVFETTGICIRPTTATYTGPTSGEYHDPLTVSGTLFDTRRGTPIVGKTLTIGFGTDNGHRDDELHGHRDVHIHAATGPRRLHGYCQLRRRYRELCFDVARRAVHAQQGADTARTRSGILRQRRHRHGERHADRGRSHARRGTLGHVHAGEPASRPRPAPTRRPICRPRNLPDRERQSARGLPQPRKATSPAMPTTSPRPPVGPSWSSPGRPVATS